MKSKAIKWAAALLLLLFVLAAVAYTFVYDGFHVVSRIMTWKGTLPEDMVMCNYMGRLCTTGENGYMSVTVSRECSPYTDVQEYIDYYFDRFVDNEVYRAENDLTLLRHETDGRKHITTVHCETMPEGYDDTYTYVTLRTNTRYFFRAMVKYDSGLNGAEAEAASNAFADSFGTRLGRTPDRMETDYYPVLPDTWSDETRAAYEKLVSSENTWLGIFSPDREELEVRLEHSFPVVLEYFHLNNDFPMDNLKKWWGEGKLVELTMQLTVNNNGDMYARTPVIDVLAGKYDEVLKGFAAKMREFGHPFMFRLNNEMNSDWTSYSGIITLSDPELYIAAWRYIYDLFAAEGVNNAIWVFNPNDNDYPPANWNSFLNYYPGNGYVQLLGVTGYNTGTYYNKLIGEVWRSFSEIYDTVEVNYAPYFGKFAWVITEYASSSYGGDKVAWINEMFERLPDYENIKAAVWFDAADYDLREGYEGIAARPYWLAETEETLQAYKKGMEGTPERFFDET